MSLDPDRPRHGTRVSEITRLRADNQLLSVQAEKRQVENERLRQELVECRDKLEHAERKLAGEWPYAGPRT